MSMNSLAAFRKGPSTDLHKLAEQHLQHDLEPSDRDALKLAARKLTTHTTIGSLLGLGIGIVLASRIRSNRLRLFEAFKTAQKPTHVKFADGREEAIPDITPLLQPSALGDAATYAFFSVAGLFLGGEGGLLSGARSARRTVASDAERLKRVERAFRGFRTDMLRREIEDLEKGEGQRSEGGEIWLGM